ncbi:adenylate/guanylate cyclase domain-containing protein [uncultured Algoriphagus sp.]|uniref:adenylate/guanylate cyclase domain-containing protein n=1 Tax=uncultured Algoriphagus sp. TaxID=417365 RepID=UPI0025987C03|nr:adenylate/guanylate cyclase domain-containing protein [uncultured Algoriphagus sp.]
MRSLIFYCVFFLTTCQLFGQSITGVDSLILLSFDSYSEHRYEEAIQLAQEALEKSEAKKDSARLLKSQLYLLMAQQELNPATYDPKSIERIIPKLASRNLWKERARAHSFSANIYAFFGDLEKAISNHLSALTIYEEHEVTTGIASVYNSLSLIYYDQYDYDEAFDYARKSLALEEGVGDLGRVHTSLNNLAIIFEHTGPIDSAIFYHKQALDIAIQTKNPYSIGLSLSNLGNNYANKGDLDLAEETLLEALRIRDSLGYTRGLAYTHNRLAALYLQKNQVNLSKFHAEKSLENAEKASEVKVTRMAYERLMEVAEKSGNARDELTFLKKSIALRDSIRNESNTKEITQLMLNYDFEKKQLLDSIQNAQQMREQSLLFEERLKVERNRQLIFLISGLFLLILVILWWRRYVFIKKSNEVIEAEKDRSDKLLLNILPAEVAEELKEKGFSEARDFEEVTVIFTDFADFTQKAQHLSAKELVNELNTCFKKFDEIIASHGLEKIKTIGDAYMAAGGLNKKSEVQAVVRAALEMRDFIIQRNNNPSTPSNAKFDMRVGINTGPVVAGIVGIKKFQFDIWGDTVNTAQRMEGACELNKINISENTYAEIQDEEGLEFEYRGELEVKGKGKLKMWFVFEKNHSAP